MFLQITAILGAVQDSFQECSEEDIWCIPCRFLLKKKIILETAAVLFTNHHVNSLVFFLQSFLSSSIKILPDLACMLQAEHSKTVVSFSPNHSNRKLFTLTELNQALRTIAIPNFSFILVCWLLDMVKVNLHPVISPKNTSS